VGVYEGEVLAMIIDRKIFWRRTLGHAGVYLTIAGTCYTLISYIGLTAIPYTREGTEVLVWLLLAGLVLLAAGLMSFYSALVWLTEPITERSLANGFTVFESECKAIPRSEKILVAAPYWISRIAFLLALLYESGSYPGYGLFLLLPFSLYCIIRSLILHFVFRKRIYRNLIALPIDMIVAFLIISVQF
jgi:hypothetical protein